MEDSSTGIKNLRKVIVNRLQVACALNALMLFAFHLLLVLHVLVFLHLPRRTSRSGRDPRHATLALAETLALVFLFAQCHLTQLAARRAPSERAWRVLRDARVPRPLTPPSKARLPGV